MKNNMFGRKFKVLKELPCIYKRVGDNYIEYFWAYEKNGELDYCIMNNKFLQPSLANTHEGEYAQKLRDRSSKILEGLIKEGDIELVKSN